MAHRLHHLQKRRVETTETQAEQTQETQHSQNSGTTSPQSNNFSINQNYRPIFEPTNTYKSYDRNTFRKNQHSLPPPESLYIIKDSEVDPCFIRTTNIVLHSQPRKTILPIGAWITPFANQQVHVVDLNSPLRCTRCKAYVNPYFQFDGTRRSATCNMCGLRFAIDENLDKTNLQSTDIATQCILDFKVADKFYYKKRTDIIKMIAVIELSMPIIELGIFGSIINSLKSVFQSHQFEDKVRVGIVFYSDNGVGFIRPPINENSQPIIFMVPNNKDNMFCCPLSDEQFLVDPNNSRDQLTGMLDFLQKYADSVWKQSKFTHSANYINALKCVKQLFEQQTGRILLFSFLDPRTGSCSIRLRNQQQSKLPLRPLHNGIYDLARQFVKSRIGIQHFYFSKDNLVSHQLATTHFLSSNTGGGLHLYSTFNSDIHGQHLYYSIFHSITKVCHYDADFACRASNGLSVLRYGAPDGLRETRDVGLSVVDSTSSFTVELQQQEKLQDNLGAFIQFAIMYTTAHGERRIRVITYKFQVSSRMEPVYDSLDYLTFANIFVRTHTSKLLKFQPAKIREQAIAWLGTMIGQFRSKCPTGRMGKVNDLSLPANLTWALSYIHTILNSRLFLNYIKVSADYRINQYLQINSANPYFFATRYYSKLYPLTHDIYEGDILPGDFLQNQDQSEDAPKISVLPRNLALTKQSIDDNGIYLYDSGDQINILVQSQASDELLNDLFDCTNLQDIELGGLPELQTSHSIRVANIITQLRRRSSLNGGMYQPLLIRTFHKKGPYSQLLTTLLRQDFFQCTFNNFIESLKSAIVIVK